MEGFKPDFSNYSDGQLIDLFMNESKSKKKLLLEDVKQEMLARLQLIGIHQMRETQRGFSILNFTDRYGVACSLQESSSASEASIWFGCDDPDPKVLVPGQGWTSIPLPKDAVSNTRMHLSRLQVQALLPYLQRFVETGGLS